MESQGRDSFLVRNEMSDVVQRLTDEQAGQLFKAMIEYNKTGIEPELDSVLSLVFVLIKQSMDRNMAAYNKKCEQNKANIERRWAKAKGNTTVYEPIRTDTKAYLPDPDPDPDPDPYPDNSITESRSDSSNTPIPSTVKKDKPICHKYGEYNNVLLTDEQMEKVKKEFPQDWGQRIERLSEYIASTGKKYKNHLATIRAWAKKETPQPVARSEPVPQKGKFFSRMGDIEKMTDEEREKECALLEEKLRKKG